MSINQLFLFVTSNGTMMPLLIGSVSIMQDGFVGPGTKLLLQYVLGSELLENKVERTTSESEF